MPDRHKSDPRLKQATSIFIQVTKTVTVKKAVSSIIRIFTLILLGVLLGSCSKKPTLTQQSLPHEVVKHLSWHLRSNLGEFTRFATALGTIEKLTHFRHQSNDAVNGLLKAGMWRKDSLSYQLHQRFGSTLTSLGIISVMKKGNSLVFHIIATEVNGISAQFNLVYNNTNAQLQGFVSNTRADRSQCQTNYLTSQYQDMRFGSCYTDLADDWYLHHAYQHLPQRQAAGAK